MKKIIIIGAATPTIIRVIDDINDLGREKIEIVGFLDNAYKKIGEDFFGHKVLGDFKAIEKHNKSDVFLINTIAGSMKDRLETSKFFLDRGYVFTNIIHPGVNVKQVQIGSGNLIYENATIHPFVKIGNQCVISSNSGIAHESEIGDYCFVGPASYICGKVKVGGSAFIGAGAMILPRLNIAENAYIGACALVNKPVMSGEKIMGIPGRPQ